MSGPLGASNCAAVDRLPSLQIDSPKDRSNLFVWVLGRLANDWQSVETRGSIFGNQLYQNKDRNQSGYSSQQQEDLYLPGSVLVAYMTCVCRWNHWQPPNICPLLFALFDRSLVDV